MSVTFIIRSKIPLLILFIPKGSIQLRLHEFLKDILKTFFEKEIDIRNTGNVVV